MPGREFRFWELLDVSFGALWRIREDLWREGFQAQSSLLFDPGDERAWHPGVCVTTHPVSGLFDPIPMLLGRSKPVCDGVQVRGVTKLGGPAKVTHFGLLAPLVFTSGDLVGKADDADRERLSGTWFRRHRASPNFHKLHLDDDETEALRAWCKRKDLI